MLKERARGIATLVAFLDLLLLVVSFFAAYYFRAYFLPDETRLVGWVPLRPYVWLPLVALPLFAVLLRIFRLYDSFRTTSPATIVLGLAKPFAIAALILGSLVFMLDKTYSRAFFVAFLGIFFVLVVAEKLVLKALQNMVRRRGFNYRTVLMVGVGPEAVKVARLFETHSHLGLRVIGHLSLGQEERAPGLSAPVLGTVDELSSILDHRVVDEVFVAVPARDLPRLEGHIRQCEEVGVRVHLKADFMSTFQSRIYTSDFDGMPVLTFSSTPESTDLIFVKRTIDVVGSLLLAMILSPLMLAIAIAIKCTSRGPVFHRQVRSGLNGRRFVMLKFRSMYENAEQDREALARHNEVSGPVFKMRRDPRVTPIGAYLRRFSLDELPQFRNVLRGDMSLVGPRPPLPGEVERYERWQRRRLRMKPGLTCLWQINGRSQLDFDTWMKLDMQYIDSWSLSLDFWILLRTIPAVLFAKGAH